MDLFKGTNVSEVINKIRNNIKVTTPGTVLKKDRLDLKANKNPKHITIVHMIEKIKMTFSIRSSHCALFMHQSLSKAITWYRLMMKKIESDFFFNPHFHKYKYRLNA